MAGQGMERREAIKIIAAASMASTFPGFRRWAFACDHAELQNTGPSLTSPFQPQFFTAEEFVLVDCVAEMIIPADRNPGAHEAGVAEFIDFMVFNGADFFSEKKDPIGLRFRSGLEWINGRSSNFTATCSWNVPCSRKQNY